MMLRDHYLAARGYSDLGYLFFQTIQGLAG